MTRAHACAYFGESLPAMPAAHLASQSGSAFIKISLPSPLRPTGSIGFSDARFPLWGPRSCRHATMELTPAGWQGFALTGCPAPGASTAASFLASWHVFYFALV